MSIPRWSDSASWVFTDKCITPDLFAFNFEDQHFLFTVLILTITSLNNHYFGTKERIFEYIALDTLLVYSI